MARVPRALVAEINRVLNSIRSSFDNQVPSPRVSEARLEDSRRAYLRFEEVRYAFRYRLNSDDDKLDSPEKSLNDLQYELQRLLSDPEFHRTAEQIYYRPLALSRTPNRYRLHPGLYESRNRLFQAIEFLIESLDQPAIFFEQKELWDDDIEVTTAQKIRKIVPKNQGIAPVRFDIQQLRLIIVPQNHQFLREDAANIAAAKAELTSSGERILEELERSNCDKRLLDNFRDLQSKLQSETDIIRLGLANIGCEIMCSSFQHELPDAVSAMLKAQTLGINMFVGQFPEWHTFAEKAATVNIGSAEIQQISNAAKSVIQSLKSHPEVADPKVPQTLQALNNLIEDPKLATKRAAYAVWRSIENLFIKVFQYGADYIEKSIEKTIDGASSVTAKAAVLVLMSAALAGAASLSPIASQIPESAWIAKAVDTVRKQIEELK
jgi:hypothetical protein